MLKTIVLLNVNVESVVQLVFFVFFQNLLNGKWKKQHLFEIEVFSYSVKVFPVNFDHFNASLINKGVN